jgi:hypothetical protein
MVYTNVLALLDYALKKKWVSIFFFKAESNKAKTIILYYIYIIFILY